MSAADVEAARRLPEHEELAAMLSKYFVGPITDAVVAKLRDEVASVLADPPLHAGMASGFHPSNGGRGYGCAWREELAFQRREPRSIDLAAWIAWSRPGYPPARPYCPEAYIGRWVQREPALDPPARWTMQSDGRFSAPNTPFADRVRWCFHRQGTDLDEGSVWLMDTTELGTQRLNVKRMTSTELHLKPTTSSKLRLERG